MEDLDAASLETVKEWFREYYGAANAVLVLAGDIDAKAARPLAEKYFETFLRTAAYPSEVERPEAPDQQARSPV